MAESPTVGEEFREEFGSSLLLASTGTTAGRKECASTKAEARNDQDVTAVKEESFYRKRMPNMTIKSLKLNKFFKSPK